MKICGIICEFNPFHNGHKYLLRRARELSGCDLLVCVMSGYFTQRGDIAVSDKYSRARHAVLGGADCVLELPAPFAASPAEIFAKGAIKMLTAIPDFSCLAFGCENDDLKALKHSASILNDENGQFKEVLSKRLDDGLSYVKSRAAAFEACGGRAELLQSPNNILAIEYLRALTEMRPETEILPVKRVGAGYGDSELKENFSSASAIRRNYASPLVKDNLPEYAFADMVDISALNESYGRALKLILSRSRAEDLKRTFGCGEGLENLLKSLENAPFDEILNRATSKRYTLSRIKRILCANLLGLYADDCLEFLSSELYLSPLAVKKERADEVMSALSKSVYPIITSGSDEDKLENAAKKCKNLDNFAQSQWQQIAQKTVKAKLLTI